MVEILQNIDQDRIAGLHSTEGVAFVVGKPAEDLQEIEELPDGRAFHRNTQGTGFYFVNIERGSCSCPAFRHGVSLVNGQCRHLRTYSER